MPIPSPFPRLVFPFLVVAVLLPSKLCDTRQQQLSLGARRVSRREEGGWAGVLIPLLQQILLGRMVNNKVFREKDAVLIAVVTFRMGGGRCCWVGSAGN
jgi:hypothetical protein